VLICATSAPHAIIGKDDVPRNRQITIFDIAFPRDVEESVGRAANVTLYNLEDIERFAKENILLRGMETDRAQQIIDEETGRFYEWQSYGKKPIACGLAGSC
jgi:glutamyl-tRNA reductase